MGNTPRVLCSIYEKNKLARNSHDLLKNYRKAIEKTLKSKNHGGLCHVYQGSTSEDNDAQSRTDEFEKVNERAIDSNNHNSDVAKERKNMNLSAAATSDKEKPEPPLGTITLGELLRLRDDLYQFMQTKESIVRRVNEDSTIFLTHESGGFSWSIKVTLTGRHTEGRNKA